eukprot:3558920-Prorocentrum_lima.AAC.1
MQLHHVLQLPSLWARPMPCARNAPVTRIQHQTKLVASVGCSAAQDSGWQIAGTVPRASARHTSNQD